MVHTIQVMIIEDDFRVSQINRQLIENITGFHVLVETKTAAEALAFLQRTESLPDLILLDIYIPDSPGLELFWRLRKDYPLIDIILLTATKEAETIQEVMHGGIADFLIKPVTPERLTKSFTLYRSNQVVLTSKSELTQADVDRIMGIAAPQVSSNSTDSLPKSIDQLTLDRIEKIFDSTPTAGMTAVDTGEAAGVSRSTARRYLEYLVSTGKIEAQLHYGVVGRPERIYSKP
ncbi:response regulator [Sporosarcina sp. PTS2304]|uniref:response regulator n=1 Tax=Sporosarcina sp. PTS2304 TaxID=2283194 RepID=UPI000E0D5653|nr:response regulator [Sporosarcina sp. PTS2304]AXH98325.1 response regulator [Sporosarcina sp. PTS2304]